MALLVLPMVLKLLCRHEGGCREAAPSLFCHDHPALLPAPGKWSRQGERPQGLGQTSHPEPVTAASAAVTAAIKLSPSFGFG